jgi:hypothetical protein
MQPHTGTTFPDAFHLLTLPVPVNLWTGSGNSASKWAAIGQAIDLPAELLETTRGTLLDPGYVTWISPARPSPAQVQMRRGASFVRLASEDIRAKPTKAGVASLAAPALAQALALLRKRPAPSAAATSNMVRYLVNNIRRFT